MNRKCNNFFALVLYSYSYVYLLIIDKDNMNIFSKIINNQAEYIKINYKFVYIIGL